MTPNQRSAAAKKAFRSRKRMAEARVGADKPTAAPEASKAAQIKSLLAEGLTRRQVADRVGCRIDYVRAVIQRAEKPDANKRYIRTAHEKRMDRYRSDDGYRRKYLAYQRDYYRRKKAEANAV